MKKEAVAFLILFMTVLVQAYGVEEILTIDAKEQGAVISSQLFGHNLEVTRRAVWSGLSAEMIANRKFAAVEGNRPKRWQPVGGDGIARIDTAVAYAGKQSARIDVLVQGTAAGLRQQQPVLAVGKDKSYSFRVWLKTEKARKLRIHLTADASPVVLDKELSCKAGDWQLLTGRFTSPVTQVNCTLDLTSADAGAYWLGAVSMMPADSFHGMRRDVIECLKAIKPGCLRFPGGCYAEFYRWQDGLLPVDRRPPIGPTGLDFLLRDSDDVDTQELGIDEFIALCRELGCEAALTIRLSETTPEDAAGWVEYCNGNSRTKWGKIRAERGQKKPYGVKTWFLGNELYFFGRGGMNNAGNVASRSKLYAEAVKKVDPSIHLCGCTDLVYGRLNKAWNAPLMEQAGSMLSYVSCHDYIQDSFKPADLQAYAVAAAKHLRPGFERIREEMNKPVIYDEWNTMWGKPGTVGMGFCVAGVLNLLSREGESLGVKQAYFFQPVTEGAIKVTPLSAELDTAGYVFELFKVHQGNRVLKVSGTSSVDVCASLAPDRKGIFITAVNSGAEEKTVTFLLADGTEAKKSTAGVDCLVPRTLNINETIFDRKDMQVGVIEGRRIEVKMPPGGIARIAVEIRKVAEKAE